MSNANTNLLQNVYLFKDLQAKELEQVTAVAKMETYNPGDEIFSEGDTASSLYVIKFGSVKIQHSGKENNVNIANMGTGAHFGEMAFIDGEKRSASALAVERSEIVTLDFKDLAKVLEMNPGIAVKVYRSIAHFLCGRLRVTTTDLSYAREKNIRHF